MKGNDSAQCPNSGPQEFERKLSKYVLKARLGVVAATTKFRNAGTSALTTFCCAMLYWVKSVANVSLIGYVPLESVTRAVIRRS